MIKRRLTRALLAIGLGGGLLLATAGAAGANAPFALPVKQNNRTDIVQAF